MDENEPLSDVSSDVSDCGKGVTKAGKDGDHPVRSLSAESRTIPLTTPRTDSVSATP